MVAYGPPGQLETCLTALGDAWGVTVVDNASDATCRRVVARHGGRYLDPGRNLGFAAAVNLALADIGARGGSGANVLLCNPDAEVGPGTVRRLAAALESDAGLACVAPRQRGPGAPGEDRVRWPFPSPARAWLDALGLGRLPFRRGFVIGSVLLVSGAALAEVGPFDEGYFLYAEEADWQRRAVAAGWRTALVPDAWALHEGAGTGGDPRWREARFHASGERYVRTWHGRSGWALYRAAGVAGAAARAVVLRGPRRRAAARRAWLYLRGPSRVLAGREGPGPG